MVRGPKKEFSDVFVGKVLDCILRPVVFELLRMPHHDVKSHFQIMIFISIEIGYEGDTPVGNLRVSIIC